MSKKITVDEEYLENINTHLLMIKDLNRLTVRLYGNTINSNKILDELIQSNNKEELLEFYLQSKKEIGDNINKMVGLFNFAHENFYEIKKNVQ